MNLDRQEPALRYHKNMESPILKFCRSCGAEKPAEAFYADKAKRDGLSSSCRECTKARALRFYEVNADHVKVRVSKRAKARSEAGLPRVIDPEKQAVAEERSRQACRTRYRKDIEVSRAKERARVRSVEDKERVKLWKKENPGKVRVTINKRKKRLVAGRPYTAEDVHELWVIQKGQCLYCRRRMIRTTVVCAEQMTVDHVVALAKGGMNNADNIALACRACNTSKSAQDAALFLNREDRP